MSTPAPRGQETWLAALRTEVLGGDLARARALAEQALREYPESLELRRAQAGVLQQSGQAAAAETVLHDILVQHPGDAGSAFLLARMLRQQGRTAAAAAALRACFDGPENLRDPALAINAIELLDECDRKPEAMAIADAAIATNPDDARLHAYAGMLAAQLGDFEHARAHYLFALDHDPRAATWHVPLGLANTLRYPDPSHPDFARLRALLEDAGLPDLARAELHFALGKACDDVGDHAEAARHFRQGNAIRHRSTPWSRKAWRRAIEARLASRPGSITAKPTDGFTPLFIIGMPRSGTTLLAQRLSRHPGVCNRGEQPWLARLAVRPDLAGAPGPQAIEGAAATYAAQVRQDDAGDARWFIDKQPLNFRYVDLALALFPDAGIIHCRRNPRDNALSLWMQCFLEGVQGYSYDFDDIGLVMRDCERLMAHWARRFPGRIHAVRYEDLVADPDRVVGDLATWIGLPAAAHVPAPTTEAISSASLWQARQPVYTRSVDRAAAYLPHVHELAHWNTGR